MNMLRVGHEPISFKTSVVAEHWKQLVDLESSKIETLWNNQEGDLISIKANDKWIKLFKETLRHSAKFNHSVFRDEIQSRISSLALQQEGTLDKAVDLIAPDIDSADSDEFADYSLRTSALSFLYFAADQGHAEPLKRAVLNLFQNVNHVKMSPDFVVFLEKSMRMRMRFGHLDRNGSSRVQLIISDIDVHPKKWTVLRRDLRRR